jgi:hypothetical protein
VSTFQQDQQQQHPPQTYSNSFQTQPSHLQRPPSSRVPQRIIYCSSGVRSWQQQEQQLAQQNNHTPPWGAESTCSDVVFQRIVAGFCSEYQASATPPNIWHSPSAVEQQKQHQQVHKTRGGSSSSINITRGYHGLTFFRRRKRSRD